MDSPFPDTRHALGPDSEAPGLLCIGPAVTADHLQAAYRRGIFPWYSRGQPPLWWSPEPRMTLQVAEFRLHRSLRKTLQRFVAQPGCEIRIDHDFEAVIRRCAASPRDGQDGTWIVPEIIAAYTALHRRGLAHSVETWVDGRCVGGLYGVSLGRMFFGESMFSERTDASKIALSALVALCRDLGISLIDCQQATRHLASLGAREMSRETFEAHVARAVADSAPGDWTYHSALWAQLGLAPPDPVHAVRPHLATAAPPAAPLASSADHPPAA